MSSAPTINICYANMPLESQDLADRHVLKLIQYSPTHPQAADYCLNLNLTQLDSSPRTEFWLSPEAVSYTNAGNIQISSNSQVLCGHAVIETEPQDDLEAISYAIYQQIYQLLHTSGYRHLLRTWNFIPDIHGDCRGLERYQAFCVGRAKASNHASQTTAQFPAASAIGTDTGPITIYFIAATTEGMQLENPQQVSAFCYPDIYSPMSPSFSRAMLKTWQDCTQLYISGTASVLGHETVYPENVEQQFRQTLSNLDSLCQQNPLTDRLATSISLSDVLWKVYIRRAEDFALIKQLVDSELCPVEPVLYLKGDICRKDLLLEIEGIYTN